MQPLSSGAKKCNLIATTIHHLSSYFAIKELTLFRVGLGERLEHEPNQLSGGQQQRVAIARALVNEPRLILADEPTGNLDSKISVDVMMLFLQLNDKGITIVLVTHEPVRSVMNKVLSLSFYMYYSKVA